MRVATISPCGHNSPRNLTPLRNFGADEIGMLLRGARVGQRRVRRRGGHNGHALADQLRQLRAAAGVGSGVHGMVIIALGEPPSGRYANAHCVGLQGGHAVE